MVLLAQDLPNDPSHPVRKMAHRTLDASPKQSRTWNSAEQRFRNDTNIDLNSAQGLKDVNSKETLLCLLTDHRKGTKSYSKGYLEMVELLEPILDDVDWLVSEAEGDSTTVCTKFVSLDNLSDTITCTGYLQTDGVWFHRRVSSGMSILCRSESLPLTDYLRLPKAVPHHPIRSLL